MLARIAGQRRGQLLDRVLRGVVELGGHHDVERDEQVAPGSPDARWIPLPLTRTVLPDCVPGGNLDGDRCVERRHLHLRAERRLGGW